MYVILQPPSCLTCQFQLMPKAESYQVYDDKLLLNKRSSMLPNENTLHLLADVTSCGHWHVPVPGCKPGSSLQSVVSGLPIIVKLPEQIEVLGLWASPHLLAWVYKHSTLME